jgi:hypothetical protein
LNDFDKKIDDLFKGLKKFIDETIKAAKNKKEENVVDSKPEMSNF